MSFFGRLLGTESCNGMFHYPLFMKRKEKIRQLDGMIESLEKSGEKKKCDTCGIKFTKDMSRWNGYSFDRSLCILCHKEECNMKSKDFLSYGEQKEIRELKKLKGIKK